MLIGLLTQIFTVLQPQNTVGKLPKRRVVRHHHNRAPLTMQIGEQIQHPLLILFIQVARRFIRENNRRFVDQRPGDTHTLLLTTGKLARQVRHTMPKPYLFQHLPRRRFIHHAVVMLGEHDVFQRS